MSFKYLHLLFIVYIGLFFGCGPSVSNLQPMQVKTAQYPNIPEQPLQEQGLLELSDLNPYFDDVSGGTAARLLAEDRLAEALVYFDEIILASPDVDLVLRARFVAGYIAERLGDNARALKDLTASATSMPLIADLAWERAARAALKLGLLEDAVVCANKVLSTSVFAEDASMTRADALRLQKKYFEAHDAYKLYLEAYSSGTRKYEAYARIVECIVKGVAEQPFMSEKLEIGYTVLQQLQAESPSGYWTGYAEGFEESIMSGLEMEIPTDRPARRAALNAYQKALDLKNKMQNESAEKEYDNVIRLAKNNTALLCTALLERAVTVQQQRQHDRSALLFEETAAACSEPSIRVRALYRGAKAYTSAGKHEDAIRLYSQVESDFPEHSYADDSRLNSASCYLKLGDKDKFISMLSELPELYPKGDMRAEALWIVALHYLQESNILAAKEILVRYYEMFPRETGWYSSGRSGYWLGRVEEKLGNTLSAAGYYEYVIAGAPFSFYMVLAYNRLLEIDKKRAEDLIASLAPHKNVSVELRFKQSILDENKAFAEAVELHRMGLVSNAKRIFNSVLNTPGIPLEMNWIVAAMERRAGRFSDAKDTVTKKERGWQDRYPADADLLPWSLAYPTVFEDSVYKASERWNVSPFLIWAIMREESGFNPKIESWANAIGLMQLIMPTAKSMGKKIGINVTRQNLRTPEVNIPLGTAYLSHLNEYFGGHLIFSIAGYNAGEGAVLKWIKNKNHNDADLFVELIPYDQTRGYTKRVLGTVATYMFLYSDKRKILSFPLIIP